MPPTEGCATQIKRTCFGKHSCPTVPAAVPLALQRSCFHLGLPTKARPFPFHRGHSSHGQLLLRDFPSACQRLWENHVAL